MTVALAGEAQSEPLRISPATIEGRRTLRFEGVTVLGPLLNLDRQHKGLASPRGFEPRLLQRRSAWQLLARVVERPLDNTREAAVI